MDSVKVSVPRLFLARGFSSSNIHHPPVFPAPPLFSKPGKWVMMRDKADGFNSDGRTLHVTDYMQRATVIFPLPSSIASLSRRGLDNPG